MEYFEIVDVLARKVLTVSGNPTVEVEITLDDGTVGRASVPGDMKNAAPVEIAVENVNIELAEALMAMNAIEQKSVDRLMLEIDGSEDASRLGANAIMACSLACAKAAAFSSGLTLYNYIGGVGAGSIPELCEDTDSLALCSYATLSQFVEAASRERTEGKMITLSAGTDESFDDVLADIAVALGANGVLTSCTAVYNQLLRIEEDFIYN